jgi:hypothetical protein
VERAGESANDARQGLGPLPPRMEQEDLRRRNRSEKHQNFSEGVPAGQVRGKCRITSCQFTSFSCTEDLHPERFFRVNIRSESDPISRSLAFCHRSRSRDFTRTTA